MLPLEFPNAEEEFRTFVESWLELLSGGAYAEAFALLDEPNSYGVAWGAAELTEALAGYGHPSSRISSPARASGSPSSSLVVLADGSGYSYWHSMPINGEWSPLEAQFEFLRRPSGFAVVLHDIHVP